VRLDPGTRGLDITDVVDASQPGVRIGFHFGPLAKASLDDAVAELSWPEVAIPGAASLELLTGLEWRAYWGSVDPIVRWHSTGLGRKTPVTLIAVGRRQQVAPLIPKLEFADADVNPPIPHSLQVDSEIGRWH